MIQRSSSFTFDEEGSSDAISCGEFDQAFFQTESVNSIVEAIDTVWPQSHLMECTPDNSSQNYPSPDGASPCLSRCANESIVPDVTDVSPSSIRASAVQEIYVSSSNSESTHHSSNVSRPESPLHPSSCDQRIQVDLNSFWCPVCNHLYNTLECPLHPTNCQADMPTESYARLTLPRCLKLVHKDGVWRVFVTKRQPCSTRFGPLVAPLLGGDVTNITASQIYRIDSVEQNIRSFHYLKLGDESLCNWMMFVRRVTRPDERKMTEPNCIAYQQGSEGIYFLTVRRIISGEELTVCLAPHYARQCYLPVIVPSLPSLQSHEAKTPKPTFSYSGQDEIHCFRCHITFGSEEAFRIHCLGHEGELMRRGFSATPLDLPDTIQLDNDLTTTSSHGLDLANGQAFIKLHKPQPNQSHWPNTDPVSVSTSTGAPPVYFSARLRCSLCEIETKGLTDLVVHTDLMHSILRPQIFRVEQKSFFGSFSQPVVASEKESVSTQAGPSTSHNDSFIVDLDGHTDQEGPDDGWLINLNDSNSSKTDRLDLCYGCGLCHQRFPNMITLEQHKVMDHDVNETNSSVNVSDPPTCSGAPSVTSCSRNGPFVSTSMPVDSIGGSPKGLPCYICERILSTASSYATHMRSHNLDLPYYSTVIPNNRGVDENTPGPPPLRYSVSSLRPRCCIPSTEGFFHCRVCGMSLKNHKLWQEHSLTHRRDSDDRFPCLVCSIEPDRVYDTFGQLQRHMRQVHSNQIFPCPFCARTFGRRKNLKNHIVTHTGLREFTCPVVGCDRSFGRKDKLKSHLKLHIVESQQNDRAISDVFGLPEINSSLDYFRDLSAHGNPRTYIHQLKKPFGIYSFISIDACPVPGPRWPLNFFGIVRKNTWDEAERLASIARNSKQTFWFGHYPTSTIVSPEGDIHQLFGSTGYAYFSGHLHTFLNLLPRLYHLQSEKFWELELGDWRDNRYFRLVAVDDDLVSFVDHRVHPKAEENLDWPLALITNPKDSRFLLPSKEPWDRVRSSTHIRVLAWSKWIITSVDVFIDETNVGGAVQTTDSSGSGSPLFVLRWNPRSFADGSVHTIRVVVNDSRGNSRVASQPFAIGNEAPNFYHFRSYAALVPNHAHNAQVIFYLAWLVSFLQFALARLSVCCGGMLSSRCFYSRGLRFAVKNRRVFGLIIFYHIYMLCGPIFLGFLLDDFFGAAFSFGLFVAGVFIPEALTYEFEIIQLVIFWCMMPVYLWHCGKSKLLLQRLTNETPDSSSQESVPPSRLRRPNFIRSMPVGLFIALLLFSIIQFIFVLLTVWFPYGWTSVVLSPGRVFPMIIFWYLCIQSRSQFQL